MSEFKLIPTYGKQSVPVFKIRKQGLKHSIHDLFVNIMLEGDVSKSWLSGDNSQIVPTETQKNTCYALAMKTNFTAPEQYALALAKDMLTRHTHLTGVRVSVDDRTWERAKVGNVAHNHVFYSARDPIKRTCRVYLTHTSQEVWSGVRDINLMKTTQSGFSGFIQDEYTTLQPVGDGVGSPDRIMCTQLETEWRWGRLPEGDINAVNKRIFDCMLEKWSGPASTGKYSKSVQETAYVMATQVLKEFKGVEEVFLATPNIHHYTYPLEAFNLPNANVVFQSTDCHTTASGRIETRVLRNSVRSRM